MEAGVIPCNGVIRIRQNSSKLLDEMWSVASFLKLLDNPGDDFIMNSIRVNLDLSRRPW